MGAFLYRTWSPDTKPDDASTRNITIRYVPASEDVATPTEDLPRAEGVVLSTSEEELIRQRRESQTTAEAGSAQNGRHEVIEGDANAPQTFV